MPETSVYEHDGSVFRENHIGRSGKISVVQTISVSETEEAAPDFHLRLRILRPDGGHHSASGLPVYYVCHFCPETLFRARIGYVEAVRIFCLVVNSDVSGSVP